MSVSSLGAGFTTSLPIDIEFPPGYRRGPRRSFDLCVLESAARRPKTRTGHRDDIQLHFLARGDHPCLTELTGPDSDSPILHEWFNSITGIKRLEIQEDGGHAAVELEDEFSSTLPLPRQQSIISTASTASASSTDSDYGSFNGRASLSSVSSTHSLQVPLSASANNDHYLGRTRRSSAPTRQANGDLPPPSSHKNRRARRRSVLDEKRSSICSQDSDRSTEEQGNLMRLVKSSVRNINALEDGNTRLALKSI